MDPIINQKLETTLSIEKVKEIKTSQEFVALLISEGIFENETDANLFLLEGVQNAANADDEFPIHVYDKDEQMNEANKIVENIGEMLTDSYIDKLK